MEITWKLEDIYNEILMFGYAALAILATVAHRVGVLVSISRESAKTDEAPELRKKKHPPVDIFPKRDPAIGKTFDGPTRPGR